MRRKEIERSRALSIKAFVLILIDISIGAYISTVLSIGNKGGSYHERYRKESKTAEIDNKGNQQIA